MTKSKTELIQILETVRFLDEGGYYHQIRKKNHAKLENVKTQHDQRFRSLRTFNASPDSPRSL